MAGLSGAELVEWVAASCARHGVPVKMTDARIVSVVAVLLSGGASRPNGAKRRGPAAPHGSKAPDDVNSGGVKAPDTSDAGGDDDVVNDG